MKNFKKVFDNFKSSDDVEKFIVADSKTSILFPKYREISIEVGLRTKNSSALHCSQNSAERCFHNRLLAVRRMRGEHEFGCFLLGCLYSLGSQ